jgi:hypothetical protein
LLFEFAQRFASFYYATLATRHRQYAHRSLFSSPNGSIVGAMGVFINHNFARERAIHVSTISRGQNDSEDPPSQSRISEAFPNGFSD